MAAATYASLFDQGRGDPFDRHVFACVLALAVADDIRPVTVALGLDGATLAELVSSYFPEAADSLTEIGASDGVSSGDDALEEPDLRQLLLDHRGSGSAEEAWLAAIIARRSLAPNHLWQDLGLVNRTDLGRLLHRHFPILAALNDQDMKWKKFFYRQLCQRDGILVCKAPNCAVCSDASVCFSGEVGEPLLALR